MMSRGKALVNLSLAKTKGQAETRYIIQGHNIINRQDVVTHDKTHLRRETLTHDGTNQRQETAIHDTIQPRQNDELHDTTNLRQETLTHDATNQTQETEKHIHDTTQLRQNDELHDTTNLRQETLTHVALNQRQETVMHDTSQQKQNNELHDTTYLRQETLTHVVTNQRQETVIHDTIQPRQNDEPHDTVYPRQSRRTNGEVQLTAGTDRYETRPSNLRKGSVTLPPNMDVDDYDLDDDVIDPDWEYKKNNNDYSDSNDSNINNDEMEINEVDHEETVETETSSASNRKRKRCTLKQKHKKLRMNGEAYLGVSTNDEGVKTHCKERAGRLMCPSGCSKKCKKQSKNRQCTLITEDNRSAVFEKFWKEMTWNEKKMYVVSLVEKTQVAQRTTGGPSRRSFSFRYHLWQNNNRVVVCKSMFCNTLGISEKTIHNWITDATCGVPKGKATSSSIPARNERRESAKEYLLGLPNMPSHYCRSSSSKKYLEPLFASISEVYREYKKHLL